MIKFSFILADIPGILSKSFIKGTILEALYQQGVHSALCSRWNRSRSLQSKQDKRVALMYEQLSQAQALYGDVARWATSLSELVVNGIQYRCVRKDDPNGDANVGFLTWKRPSVYAVGQIQQILRIKARGSEETVFIVRRYQAAPVRFSTKVWDDIFAHKALGLLVVGEGLQDVTEVVPLSHLIGHIAINRLERSYGVALMTLQLAKASATLWLCNVSDSPLGFARPPANTRIGCALL